MQNPKEKIEYVKPEIIATYSEQELEDQFASVYGISGFASWQHFKNEHKV